MTRDEMVEEIKIILKGYDDIIEKLKLGRQEKIYEDLLGLPSPWKRGGPQHIDWTYRQSYTDATAQWEVDQTAKIG